MIDLIVEESEIELEAGESSIELDISEQFVEGGGGANLQSNKTVAPSTSQVEVRPDAGYDGLEKVTVEAMPEGALSPIDIDFNDDTGAFTAEARVGTSGYLSDDAFVGGGFLLDTQEAATITPSNIQQQAVAAHKYTTGAVVVDPIPSEYIIPSGTKNITANGNAQDVKSYEKVNVSVPNSYSASDEGKVVQSGALVSQSSQTVTENGTYDTTTKNEVVVDVQSGGGGATVIASGTFVGNDRYAISIPVGTKMAETDFAFVIHLPKNLEITYVDDSNNQILLWIQYVVLKKTQRFDLSSVANNIKSTNTLGLTVNNDGTITSLNPNGTAAIRVSSRANGYIFAMSGNETSQTISRTATGFNVNVSSAAWMMVFRTGYTYEWEVIYFGSDPTNDIVEVV